MEVRRLHQLAVEPVTGCVQRIHGGGEHETYLSKVTCVFDDMLPRSGIQILAIVNLKQQVYQAPYVHAFRLPCLMGIQKSRCDVGHSVHASP